MSMPLDDDQIEIIQEFATESRDMIEQLEPAIIELGQNSDSETMNAIFRLFHSMKGSAGFLEFDHMTRVAHAAENLLDLIRNDEIDLVPDHVTLLCAACDFAKEALDMVESDYNDDAMVAPADDISERLHQAIEVAQKAKEAGGEEPAEEADQPAVTPAEQPDSSLDFPEMEITDEMRLSFVQEGKHLNELQTLIAPLLGDFLVEEGVKEESVSKAVETQKKPVGEILVDQGAASKDQVDSALKKQQETIKKAKAKAKPAARTKTPAKRQDIRVELGKLDSLINLIGELVIAENMLIHNPDLKGLELENFNKAGQHMSKLVRELQEMAMTIRMIPVSGLFRRMIRLVHDISVKAGKKVDLELIGEETEIDKTVIETITDPLVHLLRNSLDHGLEPPDERIAAGKDETGTVKLSARHEEGEVWVTIEDDGRGLNKEKILEKAISKGLIEGDGSDMSDRQINNLIFAPGFSTADKVTDISGRGVGMDVVKKNLEKIKGKIDVSSTPGQGSKITLRIPLTLAIIDGMIVRVGTSTCIVPTLSMLEAFRPVMDQITITPDGDELAKVRENFLPIVRLHDILGKKPDSHDLADGILIVLEYQETRFCLFIDEIVGQQQTVIKGLSNFIGNVPGVSGCTILGDGEVCLILDVGALTDSAEKKSL